jgi:tetratricopeptide (TPR) repeat protein
MAYGFFLLIAGRPHQAIDYFTQAVRMEPLTLTPSLELGLAYDSNGDAAKALKEFERGKGLIGNHVLLNGSFLVFALEIGDRPLIEEYLSIIENDPATLPLGRSFSKTMVNLLDSPEAARRELRRSYGDPTFDAPISRGVIATYAAYFGAPELALEIFEDLEEERVLPGETIWRPIYKDVRRLPAFKDFVRRRGLVAYWRDTGNWAKFCRPLGHDDFECQ